MEPAEQRISDQERQQVAEVLRQAAGEGRIDVDELDKRLDATFAARTYAELVPITADLPVANIGALPVPRSSALVAGPAHESSFAMMSTTRRRGPWQVPSTSWWTSTRWSSATAGRSWGTTASPGRGSRPSHDPTRRSCGCAAAPSWAGSTSSVDEGSRHPSASRTRPGQAEVRAGGRPSTPRSRPARAAAPRTGWWSHRRSPRCRPRSGCRCRAAPPGRAGRPPGSTGPARR